MFYLINILLIGINLQVFLFQNFWMYQGVFFYLLLSACMCCSLIEQSKFKSPKNVPLALLVPCVTICSLLVVSVGLAQNELWTGPFLKYLNFFMMICLYKFIVEYLDGERFMRILTIMKYCLTANLLMAVFQIFNLCPFLVLRKDMSIWENNIVFGFLGNPSIFSGFIAMLSPLYLIKRTREDCLCLILLFLILFFTGTTKGDPSIGGFVTFGICMLFFIKSKPKILALVLSLFIAVFIFLNIIGMVPKHFFLAQGRIELWQYYWDIFQHHKIQLSNNYYWGNPISGYGLGVINQIAEQTPFPRTKNLHTEYFHYLFEMGFIWLALILNLIISFLKNIAETKEQLVLKTIIIGFLTFACFNPTSHNWMISIYVMVAYSGFYVLKREVRCG